MVASCLPWGCGLESWEPEQTTLLTPDTSEVPPSIVQQERQGTRDIAAYMSVPADRRGRLD